MSAARDLIRAAYDECLRHYPITLSTVAECRLGVIVDRFRFAAEALLSEPEPDPDARLRELWTFVQGLRSELATATDRAGRAAFVAYDNIEARINSLLAQPAAQKASGGEAEQLVPVLDDPGGVNALRREVEQAAKRLHEARYKLAQVQREAFRKSHEQFDKMVRALLAGGPKYEANNSEAP